ncbi:hypothetical protein Rsub_13110 [Raphidocelis subcapitata]|uniref:EGF-like domain-containing protein n=1 Tax=Raphidocelis subcapitata TaxID=307507 RepID=A0A2V0PJK6_9CHLO|nr:hypothetical protein Rsub_13110 [Raphidocelis subcapitata]|eukprot:GBF99978.1 hypothetical protein Rsub_13110 [Raphidocelis subcapitata]
MRQQQALRGPGPCLGLALAVALLPGPAGALAGDRRGLLAAGGCAATAGSYRVTYKGPQPPIWAGDSSAPRDWYCFLVNATHAGCDPSGDRCCLSGDTGGGVGGPPQTGVPPKFKSLVLSAPSPACLTPGARRAVRWYVNIGPARRGRREGNSIRVPLSGLPPAGGSVCIELLAANATGCGTMAALCGNGRSCGVVVATKPFKAGAGQPKEPCCVGEEVTIACSGGLVLKDGRCAVPNCGAGAYFDPAAGLCACSPDYFWGSPLGVGPPFCVPCTYFDPFCAVCNASRGVPTG